MCWRCVSPCLGLCCYVKYSKYVYIVKVNPSYKRYLHFLGGALAISGVIFVSGRLYKYSGQVNFNDFSALDGLFLVLVGCLYGSANLLLALAWQQVLAFLQVRIIAIWAIRTYGISLLAKYVPGNIFQFTGRQAIGMAAGIAARPLLQSTAYELGMLSVLGVFFGILLFPLFFTTISEWEAFLIFGGVLIAAVCWLTRYLSSHVAIACVLHGLFLAGSGLTFWIILERVSLVDNLPVVIICGAYVIAWLIGLVTPGAPAGIGVREAVLLSLLGSLVPPADLVLAILLGRIINIIGDLFFFGICFFLKSNRF